MTEKRKMRSSGGERERERGGEEGDKDGGTFPELQRRRELTLTRISVRQVRTYFNARA